MIKTVHLREHITLVNRDKTKKVIARVDTGATKSSIDITLAAELKLGPIFRTNVVKSAAGTTLRPVVHCSLIIRNERFRGLFTVADRNHMKYPVLIGRNILRKTDFLIDPKPKVIGK